MLYVGSKSYSCVEFGQSEMTMSLYGGRELIFNSVIAERVLTVGRSAFFNKAELKEDFIPSKEVFNLTRKENWAWAVRAGDPIP